MSKLDNSVINTIKGLSLDIIKEAKSGNVYEALGTPNIFYSLFLNNLNYKREDPNFINRDRLVVTNSMLSVFYSTLHLFGYNISLDTLKEYKKLNSDLNGYANPNLVGIQIGSLSRGDVITSAFGIALGERYLENLIKFENNKCNLVNYYTYCICDLKDLQESVAYETIRLASEEKLKKLAIICHVDINLDNSYRSVINKYRDANIEVIEIKNGHNFSDIDYEIEGIKSSKNVSLIIVYTNVCKEYGKNELKIKPNKPLSDEDTLIVKSSLQLNGEFQVKESIYDDLAKLVDKRQNKYLAKWQNELKENISDLKIKEIIDFMSTTNVKINFNSENLKLNENYNEELILGNKKIFNIFASKSPFVLAISNDFTNTNCAITSSKIMDRFNTLGRNITYPVSLDTLGGIANGLSSLGFQVFMSSTLIDSVHLLKSIKFSNIFLYPVHYIFTQDSFTNTYEDMGVNPIYELNYLRMIPNLITIRPCDINEIIGSYEIIANYRKSTALVIGGAKTNKLVLTNPKYVVAGAYRVRREKEIANAILIATGEEVNYALEIAEELIPYGIDLRVISMPSQELFARQNTRYQYSLLPKELKIFTLEFGDNTTWLKYATNEDYIFSLKKYGTSGTKEELLNYYNLNKDYIKAKIVELMKS